MRWRLTTGRTLIETHQSVFDRYSFKRTLLSQTVLTRQIRWRVQELLRIDGDAP